MQILKGGKVKILLKEMVIGEEYEEDKTFPMRYFEQLKKMIALSRKTVLLTRHPVDRINSLNNVPDSDSVNDDVKLVFRENAAFGEVSNFLGCKLIDVSEIYKNPDEFFDSLLMLLEKHRIGAGRSILEFDNSKVAKDLVLLDSWARDSFVKHSGFVTNIHKEKSDVLCLHDSRVCHVVEQYHSLDFY